MAAIGVVTGASSGIGRSYAERLASNGMQLVLVARRADRLDELKRDLARRGASVQTIVADLGRDDDVQRLCADLSALPIDLLVNNAGLAHYMPFAQLPMEHARELIDVNALAPVLLTRAVIPGMVARGSGAIINVASLLAFSGRRPCSAAATTCGIRCNQGVRRHFHRDSGGGTRRHRRQSASGLPRGRAQRVSFSSGN